MICHICDNVTARGYCNVCGSMKYGNATYSITSGRPIARAYGCMPAFQKLTRGFESRIRVVDDYVEPKRLTKSGR